MTCVPISVVDAQRFADAHQKDILIIVGYDQEACVTNIVTWGRTPELKAVAAAGGTKIEAVLQLRDAPRAMHEDYRVQGEAAMVVDRLRAAIDKAVGAIRPILERQKQLTSVERVVAMVIGDLEAELLPRD